MEGKDGDAGALTSWWGGTPLFEEHYQDQEW